MGSKKKLSQAMRREAHSTFEQHMAILQRCFRARPKWISRKVWLWCANIFIDLSALEEALGLQRR